MLQKNKILLIICFFVLDLYLFVLILINHPNFLCFSKNYKCLEIIKSEFSSPLSMLLPFLLISLLFLFFVSKRIQKNIFILLIIISIPILFLIFSSPIDCDTMFCERDFSAKLLRPLYPITTVLTIIISAIYFHFKDKKSQPTVRQWVPEKDVVK